MIRVMLRSGLVLYKYVPFGYFVFIYTHLLKDSTIFQTTTQATVSPPSPQFSYDQYHKYSINGSAQSRSL